MKRIHWNRGKPERKPPLEMNLVYLPTMDVWLLLDMPPEQQKRITGVYQTSDYVYVDFGYTMAEIHVDYGNRTEPIAHVGYRVPVTPAHALPLRYRLYPSSHILNAPRLVKVTADTGRPQV